MKLQDQVSSLAPSQRLKELGAKQKSLYYWNADGTFFGPFKNDEKAPIGLFSAFTVAELGEMFPCEAEIISRLNFKFAGTSIVTKEALCWNLRQDEKFPYHWIKAETEADARAKYLIYLIENGLVKS